MILNACNGNHLKKKLVKHFMAKNRMDGNFNVERDLSVNYLSPFKMIFWCVTTLKA